MPIRILCVEDNPQNLRLVRKILKHAGYEVLEAIDGLSGLETAVDEQPDLILMDVNLPDIDGLEVTTQLKRMPEVGQTPIIALTANAMYGDEERCLAAGCDDYLAKPINRSGLLETVGKHVPEAQTS